MMFGLGTFAHPKEKEKRKKKKEKRKKIKEVVSLYNNVSKLLLDVVITG
jgi:isopentenyl phosphate kinase